MQFLHQLKKIFVLTVAAVSIAIVNSNPANALSIAENYLQQISQNTYSILAFLQNPRNFAGVGVSLMQPDTGDDTITTLAQQSLALLGFKFTMSQLAANNLQIQLTADIVGRDVSEFSGKDPKILIDVPNINDITYSTLVGLPPVPSAKIDIYAFIKNASSANTKRPTPNDSWEGDDDAKEKYITYFNSVSAIESFNAYVLSQIAFQDTMKANETRDQLISMASNSSWIARIATQELGRVFRQILLFESQNFVLNAQIEKDLRQLLTAQVMTNALLIKTNDLNETQLIQAAKGKQVGPTGV